GASPSGDPEGVLKANVLTSTQAETLAPRTKARAEYAALLAAGGGWAPPAAVREPMAVWDFATAEKRMTAATQVLDLRAKVEAAEQAAGVAPSPALKTAYEGAAASFDDALAVGNDELA